jgi:hypothetical protein
MVIIFTKNDVNPVELLPMIVLKLAKSSFIVAAAIEIMPINPIRVRDTLLAIFALILRNIFHLLTVFLFPLNYPHA